MGPRPAAWEWGKPEAERLSASLPPFFPSEVPQNFIVYDQEGRKNLYTMISPDILMEILHYSQVYNIGIEITWIVGRGSRYRIQKASSNKKEEGGKKQKNQKTQTPKPNLCYCTGWEQSWDVGRRVGGRPPKAEIPGDRRQPPLRSTTCRHRLLGQDTHQAAAAATSKLVKKV